MLLRVRTMASARFSDRWGLIVLISGISQNFE